MSWPGSDPGTHPQQPHCDPGADAASREAQKWIEAVTGRRFGDKDFRGALENGILLCELLSSIKQGLVKKINRLPTPIAGLDNITLFLHGCEQLGLKGSQLFDPGDLQDSSTRPNLKCSDYSRKQKNVLITIYWLGKAANSCTSYSGPTLDLKEFEGLLSQMRKEAEDSEGPKRSVRDSGYIDCWDSERSDSLSSPRHGRDDSFDSLDSFGSRSQQTPSPDVVFRGSSDGRGSDSESDAPSRRMPDMRKDDMLARRTSYSEPRTAVPFNQYLPNRSNQSSYVPGSLRRRRQEQDEGRGSWSSATSPVGPERHFSSSAASCPSESCRVAETTSVVVTSPVTPTASDTPALPKKSSEKEEGSTSLSIDLGKDDMWTRRTLTSPRRSPTHFLPVPSAQHSRSGKAEDNRNQPQRRPSWLDDDDLSPIYSHRSSVSDNSESMSMIDMRCDEEVFLQPHSQLRHELMHNQYNRLREEESHWQDDLARWKNRRRSISQDLIKKEEERKIMEQLMTGDGNTSQRRKSIKTYREIVEDKERRERELHEAYSKARTPVEAAEVLQRYAQRFTISEAVLQQLHLPRQLERSVSADPSGPATEHNPLRYLRQQSLPVPRFTSTLEAMVSGIPKAQGGASLPNRTPPQTISNEDMEPIQVDGMIQVNGDQGQGLCRESKNRPSPPKFQPSPTRQTSPSLTRPCQEELEAETAVKLLQADSYNTRVSPTAEAKLAPSFFTTPSLEDSRAHPTLEATPSQPKSLPTELHGEGVDQEQVPATGSDLLETNGGGKSATVTSARGEHQPVSESTATARKCITANSVLTESALVHHHHGDIPPFTTEISHLTLDLAPKAGGQSSSTHPTDQVESASINTTSPALHLARPLEYWVWDPDEERKRQERWQREQERLLQKKYRHQQEKLKQEWERAQKEVEEEERRYHEEEQRILEETVTPLTPHSSNLTSPSYRDPSLPIVRSLADWERKQELLERRMKVKETGLEIEDKAAEHKKVNEDCMQRRESPQVRSCGKDSTAVQPQQNGQRQQMDASRGKATHLQHTQGTPCKKLSSEQEEMSLKTASLDCSWSSQHTLSGSPRRVGSCENVGTNSPKSSSPSSSCSSDVQPPSPNRSVSGRKLCSSCGHPLGRGAAMVIETLNLYFHISCFKCGICRGQLGDTSTGTDVRIRNGLLNCQQCYIKSRVAGQPTTL